MALDTKKFLTRTASAAVFVVLLLGCVWLHYISFILFFLVVGFVGHYEYYKLAETQGKKPMKWLGYILHFLIIASLPLLYQYGSYKTVLLLAAFALAGPLFMLVELFRDKTSVFNVPAVLMATLYVTVPCFLLNSMAVKYFFFEREHIVQFDPHRVLGMIFFIWINDTGAYLVGSFLGKHKLYPRISPGKTWEGTIGGVLLCIALSFIMVKIFPEIDLQQWIVISATVAVFGTLGDLVESMLKRTAGVKDSGAIMPGHGGALDRFDSLIFATPFVFAVLLPVS